MSAADYKKPKDMTETELLAYAAGCSETNPVWKLLLGARNTAQTLRGAVFFDGSVGDLDGFGVDENAIDQMFWQLDRQLEALGEILMRERRAQSAEPSKPTEDPVVQ